MDFMVTIEDINVKFTDINFGSQRLHIITTLLSKKIYRLLYSVIQIQQTTNNNNNLRVPILWVSPKEDISENMSDEEISDILSTSVVEEIKKRI